MRGPSRAPQIDLLKNKRDEHWSMLEIVSALCNRRYTEKTVGYAGAARSPLSARLSSVPGPPGPLPPGRGAVRGGCAAEPAWRRACLRAACAESHDQALVGDKTIAFR